MVSVMMVFWLVKPGSAAHSGTAPYQHSPLGAWETLPPSSPLRLCKPCKHLKSRIGQSQPATQLSELTSWWRLQFFAATCFFSNKKNAKKNNFNCFEVKYLHCVTLTWRIISHHLHLHCAWPQLYVQAFVYRIIPMNTRACNLHTLHITHDAPIRK